MKFIIDLDKKHRDNGSGYDINFIIKLQFYNFSKYKNKNFKFQ